MAQPPREEDYQSIVVEGTVRVHALAKGGVKVARKPAAVIGRLDRQTQVGDRICREA